MSYSQRVSATLNRPCLQCLLLDVSGSMAEKWGMDAGQSKAQAVADVANRMIDAIVTRCSLGQEVREYFQLLFVRYGGGVIGLDGEAPRIMTVSEMKARARSERRWVTMKDGAQTVSIEKEEAVWLSPQADGGTPMHAGFAAAGRLIEGWLHSHGDCFPPIVCNVTDGQPDDRDAAAQAASALRSLATSDGETLLFNCHISEHTGQPVYFPATDARLSDQYARYLFAMSSVLPPPMVARARGLGIELEDGARGFVYNGDLPALTVFLDIGTQALNLLMAPR